MGAEKRRHMFRIKGSTFMVDQKYVPVKALGSGAYGVVCSVRDTEADRKVAIKKVAGVFNEVGDAKRILREAKLMRHLDGHPNIVRVFDMINPVKQSDFKDVYLVMDLMDSDLHRVIHSKNTLTEQHIKFFIYQTLCGLKYMHSANIVHRDLKPSNLLVNADCSLRICDFGLGRGMLGQHFGEEENLTEYVVTRWYRAPEIMCSCQGYDKSIDVWSLGCILGELLAKKPLFPGDNYIHLLDLIFGALGTPSKNDMYWMTNEKACDYILSLDRKEKIPWRRIFPRHKASDEALDLLDRMLVFNPERRITVDEALEHPFLASVRQDGANEMTCPAPFDWSYEQEANTKLQLQQHVMEEICYYRPETKASSTFSSICKYPAGQDPPLHTIIDFQK